MFGWLRGKTHPKHSAIYIYTQFNKMEHESNI